MCLKDQSPPVMEETLGKNVLYTHTQNRNEDKQHWNDDKGNLVFCLKGTLF